MDVQPTATFAGYLPYQPFDVPCLVRNPVSGIALYQVGRAGLDEQLDLAHEPESGILLCIPVLL